MNILRKALSAVIPGFGYRIIRDEQNTLFFTIVSSLPDEFKQLRQQTLQGRLHGFETSWEQYPDFRFVSVSYSGETMYLYKKPGQNYRISGMRLFSLKNNRFEEAELLILNNLICGLKISNSEYLLKEFDLQRIENNYVLLTGLKTDLIGKDILYQSIDPQLRRKLDISSLSEIDFNDRIYFSFYDLDDGNYLAIDKKLKVFSLVHDGKPVVKALKISFSEILDQIKGNTFDKQAHLEERH